MRLHFLWLMIISPLASAQDVWTADELSTMGESLAGRVQLNGMAVQPNIISEESYMGHLLHREAGPGFAELHETWSDIYFVVDGSATLVTGGSMVDIEESGPGEFIGRHIEGGGSRILGKGDVVHIPPGIPHHMVVEAEEGVTYFILKAQPDK